jgi:hypothetical protein
MVDTYDHFIWDWRMDLHTPPGVRFGPYAHGDTFRPEFELVVRRWRMHIEVHEGDLDQVWRQGRSSCFSWTS